MTAQAPARPQVGRNAHLPTRYSEPWKDAFVSRSLAELRPGMAILDIGSGRLPSIPPELRPEGCRYVGLDISESELRRAPDGSYDEYVVADVSEHRPELAGRFDLAVTYQVLEHVRPLDGSIENVRVYLKDGGRMVAQFSGTFSAFGMLNKALPSGLGPWAMKVLLRRDPDTVFPAHYHQCWHGKLVQIMQDWTEVEIEPRYRGATYWSFFRPLQRAYLTYEDWAAQKNKLNLATHYLVDARR